LTCSSLRFGRISVTRHNQQHEYVKVIFKPHQNTSELNIDKIKQKGIASYIFCMSPLSTSVILILVRSSYVVGIPKETGLAEREMNRNGLDHRFGQFPAAARPRQGVFGRAAGCLSDSEFLPVWKKYPGGAGTMIKAIET
jgi:hypothetical protein